MDDGAITVNISLVSSILKSSVYFCKRSMKGSSF